jgi:hypothetical protein
MFLARSATTMIRQFNQFIEICLQLLKPDSSVGIQAGCGLDGWGSIPYRSMRFYLFHNVQTGSGARPASYPMGIGGFFCEDKVAGA